MSDLTSTGRASAVQPAFIYGYGPVQAVIFGHVHWLCTDADGNRVFDFIGTGSFQAGDFLAQAPFHNGRVFTIHFTPTSYSFDLFFLNPMRQRRGRPIHPGPERPQLLRRDSRR
jgi:hypothetical protein